MALGQPGTNLPLQLTSFIGREREIVEVKRLLASTRLLTLTGAGGAGKTRLALQVASALTMQYPDGVWFIDLAPLNNAALVPQTITAVLGLRESANVSTLTLLTKYLHSRNGLVILDNCEHLVEACAQIADVLLHACSQLVVLATSREALNIAGEFAFRVPSLALPTLPSAPIEELAQSEAIRLFVERATAAHTDFKLTQQNASTIAQICARLDGMPLAIELAAARVRSLSIEQIAARLDNRFRLLSLGSRTASTRQQTLRATIDWSYGLLSEPERILFRRLSAFVGGWTLAAAESVCSDQFSGNNERNSATENWLLNTDILDLLARLVSKSMVNTQNDIGRYHLHETIRQYGHEKLLESNEVESIQDRHLNYFYKLIEEGDANLHSAGEMVWLERLEQEHDNLRTAFEWAFSKNDPDACLKFVTSMRWFLWVRGYLMEGSNSIMRAMEKSQGASKSARAQALLTFGFFMAILGEYQQADTSLKESITLFEELGDQIGIGSARHYMAISIGWQGDRVRKMALLEENLILWRSLGEKWWIAQTLSNYTPKSLVQLDPSKSATFLNEALTIWKEIGNKRGLGRCLASLAGAMEVLGNYEQALQLSTEALATLSQIGDKRSYAQCLLTSALVTARLSHFESAARLLGAAEALRESMGYRLPNEEHDQQAQIVAMIRSDLADSKFQSAWNAGRTMTMQQTTEYVMAEEQQRVALSNIAFPHESNMLTAREAQVLRLVADGLSDAQIAEKLVISPRTVNTHLSSIYSKLGVKSRIAATRYAFEHKLI
jgi:non-specific serine/threonine protein kinase